MTQRQTEDEEQKHILDDRQLIEASEARLLLRPIDTSTSSGEALSKRRQSAISVPVVSIDKVADQTSHTLAHGDSRRRRNRLPTFTEHHQHQQSDQIGSGLDEAPDGGLRCWPPSGGGGELEQQQDSNNVSSSSMASTTSEVNSNDDAASIASRLSQIVCEQEFKLVHEAGLAAGPCPATTPERADDAPAAPAAATMTIDSGGNAEPANQLQHSNSDNSHQKSYKKSATSLAVRNTSPVNDQTTTRTNSPRLLGKRHTSVYARVRHEDDQPVGEQRPCDPVANRHASFGTAGLEEAAAAAAAYRGDNETKGTIFANANAPERGDLRSLESSRNHANSRSAADLRTAGVAAGQPIVLGAGMSLADQLMLNIRRSDWTLDEFEKTFKPEPAGDSNGACATPTNPPDGAGTNAGPVEFGDKLGPYDLKAPLDGSDLLRRASRNVRSLSQQQQQQQQYNLNSNLSSVAPTLSSNSLKEPAASGGTGNQTQAQPVIDRLQESRKFSANQQLNQQQLVGQQHRLSVNSINVLSRRLSSASSIGGASSVDSYASARPFGGLTSLLASSSRRHKAAAARHHQGSEPATRGLFAGSMMRRGRRGRQHQWRHAPHGVDAETGDKSSPGCCRPCCCCCSMDCVKQYLPIVEWLPNYKWAQCWWGDVTAGLAVAVLNISTSLSAAVVAQTKLGAAFRSSIVNTFVYALLCSSRHTSFGSWSLMSQMLLDSVTRAMSDELILNRINLGPSASWSSDEYEMWHMNIIVMYTFLIGLVQLLAGLMNLGNILASFIPEALSSSMIVATAFTMAIGQLANMCGTSNKILWAIEKNTTELAWADLKNPPIDITDLFAGLFRWIQQLALLIKHRQQINLVCVCISLGCVLLLALNQTLLQNALRRLFNKRHLFIPFELILLICMVLISYTLQLKEAPYNVTTCGPISIDFVLPNLPNLRLVRELWFDSLATALISYTMVFIMAKNYANKLDYEVDSNQELIACGAGNLVGALFDALPATASFSRTAGQVEAGGKTQMASLVNCVVLFVVARFLGHHVAELPVCVMSAMLFFGFVRMMTRFTEVFHYWRLCKVDFAVWMVTFVAIITLDLVNGFVYGFIFSILTMLYRAQNRRCYMLGTIGMADVYVPLAKYPLAREIDGIKIFQFCGPIHYVSADLFERLLRQKTRVNVKQILRQQQQQQQSSMKPPVEKQHDQNKQLQQPIKFISDLAANNTNSSNNNDTSQEADSTGQQKPQLPSHIILDFSMISFIDTAGVNMIKKIIVDYQRVGITVMFASLASHVATVVKREPQLWNAHKDRFFVTLADALNRALRNNNNSSNNININNSSTAIDSNRFNQS